MNECQACPHAWPMMLGWAIRIGFPDPRMMTPAQAKLTLTECRYPAQHRGRHRSEGGAMSWIGEIEPDELAYADGLRELL